MVAHTQFYGKTAANQYRIIVPMIRKITPNVMAEDIVKVQPMMGPTGNIFNISKGDEDDS